MKYALLLLSLFSTLSWGNTPQELTLYFIPSPAGMDWTSPKSIAWSALKNRFSFEKRYLGHVFVELKCDGNTELTGMTAESFDPIYQLAVERRGMGILFHSFPGAMEEKEKIQPELNELLKNGKVNFTRFLLNPGQCQRATKYLHEYREKNVGRHYGLANRPRFGEGAGCSAFGESFLNVLDIMDHDMRESWSEAIRIPVELAGPPLSDERVGLLKVLWNGSRWADDKAKSHILTFWDPDRMHAWVKKKVSMENSGYEKLKLQNSEGLVIDKRQYPVPMGPIWLQSSDPLYSESLPQK